MSDYLYLNITCRVQDQEAFKALGFEVSPYDDEGDGYVTLHAEEYEHEIKDLPEGIPHIGYGRNDGACLSFEFACDGKVWHIVSTINEDRHVAVSVNSDGTVNEDSLREAQNFLSCMEAAIQLIGCPSPLTFPRPVKREAPPKYLSQYCSGTDTCACGGGWFNGVHITHSMLRKGTYERQA